MIFEEKESVEDWVFKNMMDLFNKEQILEAYVLERTREAVEEAVEKAVEEAAEKAKQNAEKAAAKNLYDMGMDITMIAKAVDRSVETVQGWLGLMPV